MLACLFWVVLWPFAQAHWPVVSLKDIGCCPTTYIFDVDTYVSSGIGAFSETNYTSPNIDYLRIGTSVSGELAIWEGCIVNDTIMGGGGLFGAEAAIASRFRPKTLQSRGTTADPYRAIDPGLFSHLVGVGGLCCNQDRELYNLYILKIVLSLSPSLAWPYRCY